MARFPELVGASEAAEILGVKRARIHSLMKENANFPEPVAKLRCGPIWLADEIHEFKKLPRRPGRPRIGPLRD